MDFENTTEYNDRTIYEKIKGLNDFYYDMKKFFTMFVYFLPTIDKRTMYDVEKVINTSIERSDPPLKLLQRGLLERIDNKEFVSIHNDGDAFVVT